MSSTMGQHVEIQHEVVLPLLEIKCELVVPLRWTGYLELWVYNLETCDFEHCMIEKEEVRQLVTQDVLSVRLVPHVMQAGGARAITDVVLFRTLSFVERLIIEEVENFRPDSQQL